MVQDKRRGREVIKGEAAINWNNMENETQICEETQSAVDK